MSFLHKLKAGTDNKKTIRFPGKEEEVVIRVLSEADKLKAAVATENLFKAQGISYDVATSDLYETEKTTELLFRALSDPDGKPIAKDISEFRELLTGDEKDMLVDEYTALEKECSPSPEEMPQEAFDKLLDDVKKNAEQTTSSVSNIVIARRLICSLASLLQTLQTDNGSTS